MIDLWTCRWRLLLGALLCAAMWGLPARQAEAAPSCTASMTNLSFGDVDLVSGALETASATLTYRCENDQYSRRYMRLCFNIGDGSASIASGGGHWNPRILRSSANNEMNVQFYQGGTGVIWGSSGQPVADPYDVIVDMPARTAFGGNTVTSGTLDMRGEILTGQAALPNGSYTSSFTGNHTSFRYTPSASSRDGTGDCNAATTNGGTFAFTVSSNVIKSCVVSADTLDFGSVAGLPSSTNTDAQTTVRVLCSSPTSYNVLLIPSNNDATGQGAMKGVTAGNTDSVPYRLFRNAARSQAWGNQLGSNSLTSTGTGVTQAWTVYGRVPGLPNVRPDSYRDTVTVNVTY